MILVSGSYAKKVWTRLELKSAIAGALFGGDARSSSVLPLRLDDTRLSGLAPTVGFLDLRELAVGEAVDVLATKIGPPMDEAGQDGAADTADEAIAICRAHLRPRMSAAALREFSAALRKHIAFVRSRETQQQVAVIIAELELAARLRSDKPDIRFDKAMLRIEAAVHGLSEKPAEAASLDPVKNRRGKLIVLAAGCVLAIAIAVWAVLGRPGAPAEDRSAKAALTSKVAVPATTTTTTTTTTRATSTTAATTPFTTPVPTTTTDSPPQRQATPSTPRPPQRLSLGSIVLVPTDGLDLDAGTRGYQDDPGMDISPSRDGNLINGMSHGKPKLAVVTSSAATGPGLCATVPADAWRTPLSGLYQMRVGDRVCVLTDQGNHGVLTLRTVPSAGAVDLDVDYVAWQD